MFYGTAASFTTYHESRGRSVSDTWTTSAVEAALLLSSEWLDGAYENSWVGKKTAGFTQERGWPRKNATVNRLPRNYYYRRFLAGFDPDRDDPYTFPDNVTPVQVEHATYEAAFRQLTTPGSLAVDFKPNQYTSATVEDAVSVDYNMSLTDVFDVQVQIPAVQVLMEPLLSDTGSHSALSGGAVRV